MLVDDPKTLEQIFANSPLLIATHCEDTPTILANEARFRQQHGEQIPIECHPLIRSEEACYRSSSLAVELAKRHGVHPNQIYGWKKQVLDNVASLFARGASALGDGEEEHERETAKLYTKIGQLTVERDFLARRPGR